MSAQRHVTNTLRAIEGGDSAAKSELFALLYAELHSRAVRLVHRQGKWITLQATALINEAYLRLVNGPGSINGRDHFLACAAKAMRRILVDHARRPRPSSDDQSPLDAVLAAFEDSAYDLDKLDLALVELEERDPVMARYVELRFFGGVPEDETARLLEVKLRSLQRRWHQTRDWLKDRCLGN